MYLIENSNIIQGVVDQGSKKEHDNKTLIDIGMTTDSELVIIFALFES